MARHTNAQKRRLRTPAPQTLARLQLVLNVLMPGLGTLLAGWTETGTEQLALFAIGVLLLITDRQTSLLGIIAVLSAWLWALLLSRANLHRNGWKHKPKPAMQPWLLVLFVLATLAAVVLMLYRLGLLFLP